MCLSSGKSGFVEMEEVEYLLIRARLPIDGRQATGDSADRQGRLNGRRAVGRLDGCVFT